MVIRSRSIVAALVFGVALPAPGQGPAPMRLPELPPALEAPGGRPAEGPRLFLPGQETSVGSLDVKLGQGRLVVLAESLEAPGAASPTIAVGDPNVADFVILGPRHVRVIGRRLGVTDLALTTAAGRTESLEIRVIADLVPLRDLLRRGFPTAGVELTQSLGQVLVEGQARDAQQASRIIETVENYLNALQGSSGNASSTRVAPLAAGAAPEASAEYPAPAAAPAGDPAADMTAGTATGGGATSATGQVVNLLRVPGPQQVMLKVRIAELNRTALRQIGADVLGIDRKTGAILGTQIGGARVFAEGTAARALTGTAITGASPLTTAFGILQESNVEFMISALRRNSLLKVLAEPNLVAENGRQASFLAGGEFPVPVPQIAASGVAPTITVQFKKFGVQLDFIPTVLDEEVIRLTVDPVVSTIDRSIGTTLVAGGSPVPGLNTRQAHTTVDLRPGQTLAIAGLLQVTLDAQTSRVPGLGDLPVLGPFFSNTTSQRAEKELLVLVTPYLVEPMNPGQVPPTPGDEVGEPSDFELYLLNRIEGRHGKDWRSTTNYPDPLFLSPYLRLEKTYLKGPFGFSP
jgi:pilus assembly protein CpaC